MSAPDNENIQGVKDVLSWFIDQNKSTSNKGEGIKPKNKNTYKPDYSILPDPPKPKRGSKPPPNPKSFKKEIKISWEKGLNEQQLLHWKNFSAEQQGIYLFGKTELGDFIRSGKKKKKKNINSKQRQLTQTDKKQQQLTQTDKAELHLIRKGIRENRSKKLDYNKIDWDVT